MALKINAGCNEVNIEGFVNIDLRRPDWVDECDPDLYPFLQHDLTEGIPFDDNSVEYIVAHHFLEHLYYPLGALFLMECERVLEPGGTLTVVTPDFGYVVQQYNQNPASLRWWASIMVYPYENGIKYGQSHLAAYDGKLLLEGCRKAGLEAVRLPLEDIPYCSARYPWQVGVKATKPVKKEGSEGE